MSPRRGALLAIAAGLAGALALGLLPMPSAVRLGVLAATTFVAMAAAGGGVVMLAISFGIQSDTLRTRALLLLAGAAGLLVLWTAMLLP